LPQALELLAAGGVALPEADAEALRSIEYNCCLAAMVELEGASGVPAPGGVRPGREPLRWVADNRMKGISPGRGGLTVHAGPEFSRSLWDVFKEDAKEVSRILAHEAREWIASDIVAVETHGWRYSEPINFYPASCLLLEEPAPLALAGDAFGRDGIEGAALSGIAAAERLLAYVDKRHM
jgi:predicted NAD/FAD-dependent oxidoreductase